MKKLVLFTVVTVMVLALGAPAFASQCPILIKQANEQMAKMDQNSAKVKRAKALVEEADRLHKAGNHPESEKKVQEALGLLMWPAHNSCTAATGHRGLPVACCASADLSASPILYAGRIKAPSAPRPDAPTLDKPLSGLPVGSMLSRKRRSVPRG